MSTTVGCKDYVQSEFLRVEEEIILPNQKLFPSSITVEDFLWAFGILRSRAFSRLRGQNLVLIPLADLVSLLLLVKVNSAAVAAQSEILLLSLVPGLVTKFKVVLVLAKKEWYYF